MSKIREVAVKRDKLILDEREKQAAIVPSAPEAEPLALPPAEGSSERRDQRSDRGRGQRRPLRFLACICIGLCASRVRWSRASAQTSIVAVRRSVIAASDCRQLPPRSG